MNKLGLLLCAIGFGVVACATPSGPVAPAQSGLPRLEPAQQRGQDFAVRRCSGCHTVGLDEGGATEGPAFRSLAMRYNPVSLARRFANVSAHGFDRMPPVGFTAAEAEDLMAYLETLTPN